MTDQNLLTSRIEELEVRLAFQEDLIQELNDVITRQDGQLLKLQEQLRVLAEKHKELAFRLSEDDSLEDERPPHY